MAQNEKQTLGENIQAQVNGDTLTLVIDMSAEGSWSGSGKSRVIATTRGNVSIPGSDLKMGLNLYRPK